jgi:hypothetical protein
MRAKDEENLEKGIKAFDKMNQNLIMLGKIAKHYKDEHQTDLYSTV